ncbi:MAG TPA: 4Fe-4S dicluster domain-containing protein [Thermoanaerobaculia bacterium]|nr:4Fe-4S dicluster domain-containing protein [Thermoanaerobaculia bacterium]
MSVEPLQAPSTAVPARWAKVIDHTRCIGCHACSTACKAENEVPLGVHRTYVKYAEVGTFPQVKRHYQVTRCNQCDDAPCVEICPTGAMYRRRDGIVDFDKSICIGCKACMAACPYDAIFINPEDHSAEKCNFCAHRIDVGLEPACVTVCPTQAILVGDLEDPSSRVAQIAHREPVAVRRPEKGTQPKLFYVGAHQATLDPLAARRPEGGLFLWGEQSSAHDQVVSGHPRAAESSRRGWSPQAGTSSAAALLAFDVPHTIPWDWRVGLYTLTKGIAAGTYLVALLLVLAGVVAPNRGLWTTIAPLLAIGALVATAGILVADLEHPERFWMLLTRGRWRSWLVRGAWILTGYGIVLAAHVAPVLLGGAAPSWLLPLAALGAPLAALTAIYTAWLFAQAKARDLWQNPLLPPHLLVQALLAGAATLLPVAVAVAPEAVSTLSRWLAIGAALHLAMVAGEMTLPHPTAHARLAAHELARGRYRAAFGVGVVLVAVALAAPWLSPPLAVGAALAALAGLLAYEHAYVQAGQSVPLA